MSGAQPARHPSLYQLNTRASLTALSRGLARPATLDDFPDTELDRLATLGFQWIWLLSVWQTGQASRWVSRTDPGLRREFAAQLPDLREEDIAGSGFAVAGYSTHPGLGGDEALARLRARMHDRGMRLMADFVPNHTALDHPWIRTRPDYYVHGTEDDLARSPANYTRVDAAILAHGRDPYFPGWTDTLQLDYANPATCDAMVAELQSIARRVDGVRCDMAMLLLPEIFERTWGRRALPFWGDAIRQVKAEQPDFLFMAEVYWDLEWTLLELGFDYAYDKRLYDRVRAGLVGPVRDHLRAEVAYQSRLVRFLENHDESRAAAAFPPNAHQAAAIVTYLAPGLRFFHDGQLEGRRVRVSPHLLRRPDEPADADLARFYGRLLPLLKRREVHAGRWRLLDCTPAWSGNPTSQCLVAWSWHGSGSEMTIVVVNFCHHQSQGFVRLPPGSGLVGRGVVFADLLSPARYEREGTTVEAQGLYLDLTAWGFHVFEVNTAS